MEHKKGIGKLEIKKLSTEIPLELPLKISKLDLKSMYIIAKENIILSLKDPNSFRGLVFYRTVNRVDPNTLNLDNQRLREYIKEGYFRYEESTGVEVLKLHPSIIKFFKNSTSLEESTKKHYHTLNTFTGHYSEIIKVIKPITSTERKKLREDKNVRFWSKGINGYNVIRDLLEQGVQINQNVLLQHESAEELTYFYVEPNYNIVRVFPKSIFTLETYRKEQKKVNITVDIQKDYIYISAPEFSTTYANIRRQKQVTDDYVHARFKEYTKILSDTKQKTKNKSMVNQFLISDNLHKEILSHSMKEQNLWDEIFKLSNKVVNEGIYTGGDTSNPMLVKLRNKINEYTKLTNQFPNRNRMLRILNQVESGLLNKENYESSPGAYTITF